MSTIDIQQSITQLHVMEKVQQVQQQQADLQQRHFALKLNEERKRLKEKVKDADESEFLRMRERPEDGRAQTGKEAAKKDPHKRNPPQRQGETPPQDEGAYIDIKV